MKKRVLAAVLAAMMIFTMPEISAFAEETGAETTGTEETGTEVTGTEETGTEAAGADAADPMSGTAALSGYCGGEGEEGSNLSWKIDTNNKTLTISGSGKMKDYGTYVNDTLQKTVTNAPWSSAISDGTVNRLSFSGSVTTIGENAFFGCDELKGSLSIPDTVTSIGEDAFRSCSGFTETLTLSGNLISIGKNAFIGCSGFQGTLTIPDGTATIGRGAFYNCSGFTGVLSIPKDLKTIEDDTFYGCSGFSGLIIPDGVTSIQIESFYECSGLTGTLIIPDSVTSIGDYAFSGCIGLTGNLTVPDSVTSLGHGAFAGCNKIDTAVISKNITVIPSGLFGADSYLNDQGRNLICIIFSGKVTEIQKNAFYNCSKIADIYYSGTEAEWNQIKHTENNGSLWNASVYYDSDAARKIVDSEFDEYIYRADYLTSNPAAVENNFQSTTPGQSLYDALKKNGAATAVSCWKGFTHTVDAIDDPSKVIDFSFEQKDVYEAIIFNMFEKYSTGSGSLLEKYSTQYENMNSGVQGLKDLLVNSEEYESLVNADFSKLTLEQRKTLIDKTNTVFEYDCPNLNSLLKKADVIDSIISIAGDLDDYLQYVNSAVILFQSADAEKAVLENMYASCPKSNSALAAALKECEKLTDDNASEFLQNLDVHLAGTAGKSSAMILSKLLWTKLKLKAEAACPGILLLMAEYKVLKSLSNAFLGTDNISENIFEMYAVGQVGSLLNDTYESMKTAFCADKNSDNAKNYLCVIDVGYALLDIDCTDAEEFMDSIDSTWTSKIGTVFGASDLSSQKNGIRQIQSSYKETYNNTLSAWVESLEKDFPIQYSKYQNLLNGAEKQIAGEYKIECPVDVYVYGPDGALAASVVAGKPWSNSYVTAQADGDQKMIYIPNDKKTYKLVCKGTDSGNMNITLTGYNSGNESVRTVKFDALPLTNGSEYNSSTKTDVLSEDPYTISKGSTVISPQLDTLKTDESAKHTLTITQGMVFGASGAAFSAKAAEGEDLNISAYVPVGYQFAGWQSDTGENIFGDAGSVVTTVRMPDHDVHITARIEAVNPFSDVASGAWYYDSVRYIYGKGIMTGLKEDVFGPGQELGRGQFATILYRLEGSPDVTYTAKFPDVADKMFYTKPVLWANSAGVVSGYNNGRFGPADKITREQMAVMMYRYAKYKGYDVSVSDDLSSFPDAGNVSGFASDAVRWAVGIKLISGDGGRINPQGNASRAQCAAIIMRFMNYYNNQSE